MRRPPPARCNSTALAPATIPTEAGRRNDRRCVTRLDPDLDANRSMSMSTKIRLQAQRHEDEFNTRVGLILYRD